LSSFCFSCFLSNGCPASHDQAFASVDDVLHPFITKLVRAEDPTQISESGVQDDALIKGYCMQILQSRILASSEGSDPNCLSAAGFRLQQLASFDESAQIALMDNVGNILAHFLSAQPRSTKPQQAPEPPPRTMSRLSSSASDQRRRTLSETQRALMEERRIKRTSVLVATEAEPETEA
jgi:hypothetical protein